MKPKKKEEKDPLQVVRERWPRHTIHQDFFNHFRNLTRLSSNPLIPVQHSTNTPIHAAMDSLKHLFSTDPPHKGRAFALNCVRVGDSDVTLDYCDPMYHSLTEVLGTWHSGEEDGVISEVLAFLKVKCCMRNAFYATYHGDENPDLEGKELILKHLPEENVFSTSTEGSFWNTGGNGPCSPCLRLYYDCNSMLHDPSQVREFIEANDPMCPLIWTFIFVKFTRSDNGVLEELPFTHVISAMDFENLITTVQFQLHFYSTSEITPLLESIHEFSGPGIQPYNFYAYLDGSSLVDDTDQLGMAYRVVADHLRMVLVASNDGTQIGNHGREYFLKLIDGQAIKLCVEKLKIPQKNYYKFVKKSIKAVAPMFPELGATEMRLDEIARSEDHIYHIVLAEIAQRQPPLATKKSPTTWYKTREIKFFDRTTHIVHRDSKNKCSLAALCNALLLGGKITLGANMTLISEDQLLHLVQSCLLWGNGRMELQNNLERSEFQKQVLDVLPQLRDVLPIVVKTDSINGFLDSPRTALFDYLGVPLYHGCLVPKADLVAAGGSKLTPQGLTSLQTELEEKEPYVLFWNGHFITVTKVEDSIYLLLDDISFVETHTDVFWELLKEVNQGGLFMDCNFTRVDLDPCLTTLPLTRNERKKLKKKGGQKDVADVTTTLEAPVLQNTHEPDVQSADTYNTCQDGTASCSTSKSLYKTSQINFLGRRYSVIYQEWNGPCSLIAICNALLLKGLISVDPDATNVQEDYLINCLQCYLEQRKGGLPLETDDLQMLSAPLDVDVNFNRTDGFTESPGIILFRDLGISLYHAWLPDPNDDRTATLFSYSHNSLSVALSDSVVPNVEHAREFLEGPQFTPYGLRCLRNAIEEEVPCVIFWHNHFSAVIKIKGEVYALASVSTFLGTPVVWYWLHEDGKVAVDDNFIPVELACQKPLDVKVVVDDNFIPLELPCQKPLDIPSTMSEYPEQSDLLAQVPHEGIPSTDFWPANIVSMVSFEEYVFSLKDFSESWGNHFVEKKELSDSGTSLEVADTTAIGRLISSELLEEILYAHQHSVSWNGEFDRTSILVKYGLRIKWSVWINAVGGDFTVDAAVNDYVTYADEVLSLFEVKGVGYPAFFRSLIKTLKEESRQGLMSKMDCVEFHMKLYYNLALKFTLVRADYWGGVHKIRRNAPRRVRRALKNVLAEDALIEGGDWRPVIAECGRPRLVKILLHTEDYYYYDADADAESEDSAGEDDESGEEKMITGNDQNVQKKEFPHTTQADQSADQSVKPKEFGNFLPSLDSATQFPRHTNEHASAEDDDGTVSLKSSSELDLWYSHYLQDPLDEAHSLLINSHLMTEALYDRLKEYFGMLERPDAI